MLVTLGNNLLWHCEPRLVGEWQSLYPAAPQDCFVTFVPRMYENAAVCQGARVFVLFSTPLILIGHLSLEAVSLDACIRPSQGMSIFPEVSHSTNEYKISHARPAHTSLATKDFLDGTGS